uniref:Uncharacterized protein n=1 Tax=virus sp. ctkyY8 TaxID=2827995 RepID=A0A8S5RDS2_9VIRU|nr:MAG TPA: hypothetical protein [virus sp. ctkyY8]
MIFKKFLYNFCNLSVKILSSPVVLGDFYFIGS